MWELADNEWVRVHPVTGGVHIEVIRITGAVIDTREWPILSPIGPSLLSHGSCLDDYAIRNQMGHGNKWHVHYPLMTVNQIAALRVRDVAMPDSHLWLWVPSMYLPDGLAVMDAWGFRYVTNACWYKTGERVGLGQYLRTKHELCLFGVRGRPPYARDLKTGKRPCVESAFEHDRMGHSRKPDDIHWMAEQLSPGPRIELFARRPAKGWDSWGNELITNR
jgi:N6-adenosine-specific RNA methylase IME4